jgi:hypothetical protein
MNNKKRLLERLTCTSLWRFGGADHPTTYMQLTYMHLNHMCKCSMSDEQPKRRLEILHTERILGYFTAFGGRLWRQCAHKLIPLASHASFNSPLSTPSGSSSRASEHRIMKDCVAKHAARSDGMSKSDAKKACNGEMNMERNHTGTKVPAGSLTAARKPGISETLNDK